MADHDNVRFYFQYANPVETEDELSCQKRPKLSGTKHPWESSPYYYWWLFLKKNTDYVATCDQQGEGPCSALYADFGDVRGNDFMAWWRDRGRQLFCEPHGAATRVIEPYPTGLGDPAFRIVFEVERYGDTDRAISEIRQFLQEQEPEEGFGRGGRNVSRALYQLLTKPHLHSLRQHHQAHELLRSEPGISDEKFVQKFGIALGNGTIEKAAARYREEINRMIEHVGQGVFPVITAAQADKVPSYLNRRKQAARERRREIAAGLHCVPFGPPLEEAPEVARSNQGFREFIRRTNGD